MVGKLAQLTLGVGLGKETRVRATGGKAKGTKVSGGKAARALVSQETGGKCERLIGEREIDNSLPGDKTAGQNITEGIQQKSYSEVVIEGGKEDSEGVCGGLDS